MYKFSGTYTITPASSSFSSFQSASSSVSSNPLIRPFPPLFARGQEQNDNDYHDEIDDESEFDVNVHHQHQFPVKDDTFRPYDSNSKKKQPSKQANLQVEHTENPINLQQPQYIIGTAISPAIIPLTYYPIQPTKFGTTTINGSNSKKTTTNTRSKPPSTSKKPSNGSHQNVVALNAVPLVWYPVDSIYNPNLQRDFSPGHSKQHSTSKTVKPQSSKQSNQIQAMNLAAYYGYLNHLNSRQKQPILPKLSK